MNSAKLVYLLCVSHVGDHLSLQHEGNHKNSETRGMSEDVFCIVGIDVQLERRCPFRSHISRAIIDGCLADSVPR